jgi:DNA-binding transcriptional ArsR family regulator
MSVAFPGQPVHPGRVRAARTALLAGSAHALIRRVRRVFCETTRAQIVRALCTGPLCVTDLALVVGRSRPAVSQHLRALRTAGIVVSRRRGRATYYALADRPEARTAARVLDTVAKAAA